MIRQVNAFDTTILKKGRGVVITEGAKGNKPKTYNALIFECKLLSLEVAFVVDSIIETKVIKPNDVADGNVKIQLTVPFKEPAPATNSTEVIVHGSAERTTP